MIKLPLNILVALFALGMMGCQSAEKFQATNCHYEGAYEKGANDAKDDKGLRGEALVAECPEAARKEVRKGYREGYESFSAKNKSFVDVIKERVTGTSNRPQTCMQQGDDQVCGYGCIETGGKVKCAQSANHACMSSGGKIYCGLNCRETRPGKVTCDEKETL